MIRSAAIACLGLSALVASARAQHWAFTPPHRPAPATEPGRSPIDVLVGAKLREIGLAPATEATKETLIRRLSFDLRGLPPTLAEVDSFLADDAPGSWERLVDRMLASPHFGERMALPWLDAGRYADSNGYQHDGDRQNWPWRDWLVRCFDANRPLDAMVVEMIAGDLLPEASDESRVATAFHRNHPINDEGGAIADEIRFNYVIDRANTTATTFLGLTFACAQCHDHKYDPITQREYYAFAAFFDNVDEQGVVDVRRGNRYHQFAMERPIVDLSTAEQREQEKALIAGRDAARAAKDGNAERDVDRELRALYERMPLVMVMAERKERRETRVHARGNYDTPIGDALRPDVPAVLGGLPTDGPHDRLALARWLVRSDNPLFARVLVDRIWRTLFGSGIVPTPEDFGVAGQPPTWPGLLDWLAVELIDGGYDQKRLLREILCSATYRQSAVVAATSLAADPQDLFLSRSPRPRLSSFFLRDAALSLSGLLDPTLGGPPVYPPHPVGLWRDVSFDVFGYPESRPEDLHRRSLYTFWRRTVAPPTLFDAAHRQSCVVRESHTNTPLHALVTLNDPGFVEAAECFGKRVCAEAVGDEARLALMFRMATARSPEARELAMLHAALERQRALASSDADAETKVWTAIAQLVLDLDEVLSRS
ncbi:MAG: DUF1549 and DUF1553 domain-containing protein [Planctomycetota bacterium]